MIYSTRLYYKCAFPCLNMEIEEVKVKTVWSAWMILGGLGFVKISSLPSVLTCDYSLIASAVNAQHV